jgi:hypothetical protein
VPAVLVDQPVPGELAQPRVERQRPSGQIAVQPAVRLREGVLHHVGGVEAGGQPPVHAQRDHTPQPPPVPLQQRAPGLPVSFLGEAEQLLRVGFESGHRAPSLEQTPQLRGKRDRKKLTVPDIGGQLFGVDACRRARYNPAVTVRGRQATVGCPLTPTGDRAAR